MSQWNRIFEKQQAGQLVRSSLQTLEETKIEGLTSDEHEVLARLLKALHVVDNRLSAVDPELYHRDTWNSFNGWLAPVLSEIKAFVSDKAIAHLQNANNSLDEVLGVLKPLDIGVTTEHLGAVADGVESFRKKLIEDLDATRQRSAEFKATLDGLHKEVEAVKNKLVASEQVIEQQKGRLDQSIAEFQKQFSQSESARATEFTASLQKLLAEWSAEQKKQGAESLADKSKRETEFDEFVKEAKNKNDELLKFFHKRQEEVNNIFGAIGSASLSGHFANTADRDASTANWLRVTALLLMCGMIAVGGLSFYESLLHPDLDWKIFLFRLATVVVIAIPAVYAAQESSKHRASERHNRKIHLELASIDSYLVQLPEPKRFELKEKLTEKFFGTPDYKDDAKDETNHALLDILRDAMKNLTKAK